jgi:MFS family permease
MILGGIDLEKSNKVYPWLICATAFFLRFGGLGTCLGTLAVFVPAIMKDTGIMPGELTFWVTCYSIGMMVSMLYVGYLYQKVDSRIILTISYIITMGALAMMSTYSAAWQFYVSGAVIGLAGGFFFMVPAPILVGNWFVKMRGTAMGIAGAGSSAAGIILPFVVAAVIGASSWRTAYIVLAIIGCILVLPWTIFIVRFTPAQKGMKPYGWKPNTDESEKDKEEDPSKLRGVSVKAALLSIPFVALFVAAGLASMFGGWANHVAVMAQTWGYDALFGASLASVTSIGGLMYLVMGALTDKFPVKWVTIGTLCLVATGMLFLLFLHGIPAFAYTGVFLYALQMPIVGVLIPLIMRECFGDKNYAQIFGYVQIAIGLLSGFGAPMVGSFFDRTGSYEGSFLLGVGFAAVVAVAVLVAYTFKNKLVWED